jgi:hypothetical protein
MEKSMSTHEEKLLELADKHFTDLKLLDRLKVLQLMQTTVDGGMREAVEATVDYIYEARKLAYKLGRPS